MSEVCCDDLVAGKGFVHMRMSLQPRTSAQGDLDLEHAPMSPVNEDCCAGNRNIQ